MSSAGQLRHRQVPVRALGETLIVARPSDGAPVVLSPVAAVIWHHLEVWTTVDDIDRLLGDAFPDVAEDRRLQVRQEVLATLGGDELLERG